MALPWMWGLVDGDLGETFPCGGLVAAPYVSLCRAIAIAAPSEVVYRWICQITVAPYSYDLIDNRGRRSPRQLTVGADELAVGDRFAIVFRIVDVTPGVQITAAIPSGVRQPFGPVACTYLVRRMSATQSRLIVRFDIADQAGLKRIGPVALGWGDLLMARKQLRTHKSLAESAPSS